jgi:hypothetical protein
MKYKGSFVLETETYALEIDYIYYYDAGTWEQPPEEDVEVLQVKYNGVEFTDFYWDFVDDHVHDELYEYARENYPE